MNFMTLILLDGRFTEVLRACRCTAGAKGGKVCDFAVRQILQRAALTRERVAENPLLLSRAERPTSTTHAILRVNSNAWLRPRSARAFARERTAANRIC